VSRTHRILAAAACLALAGCSTKHPTGSVASLTGQVVVRVTRTDASGNDVGGFDTLTVSGLQVRLLTDSTAVQSTVTSRGVFRFERYQPGLQTAVLLFAGVPTDSTAALHADGTPASFPDSLVLGRYGPISVSPNPVAGAAAIRFGLAHADTISVQVRTLAGAVVKQYAPGAHEAGLYQFVWDGTDDSGSPLAPGFYCVVVDKRVVLGAGLPVARPSSALDVSPIPVPVPAPESGPILCAVILKQ
jgi:hypothetical protein